LHGVVPEGELDRRRSKGRKRADAEEREQTLTEFVPHEASVGIGDALLEARVQAERVLWTA
jgi:hypothetical protein